MKMTHMKPTIFALLLSKFDLLKKIGLLVLLFSLGWNTSAQNLYLKISGKSAAETKTIDSVGYQSRHDNTKSIVDETNGLSAKLSRMGFIESEIDSSQKENDSTFLFL